MVQGFKKGFSLVELLVVIAIIGILAAVGITAYSGYTKSAKEKATLANHAQIIKFLSAEFAKCAGGEGKFIWDTDGNDTCDRQTSTGTHDGVAYVKTHVEDTQIVLYINNTLAIKNPWNVNTTSAATSGTVAGTNVVNCASATQCTVQSYTNKEAATTGAIAVKYM